MQTNTRSAIDALFVLSQSAHSPFHCCKYCEDTLKKAGFLALPKNEPISLTPGGKYYIDLYDATCIAFTVGKKVSAGKKLPKLRMITAHTDWPSFLIKPQPELTQGSYGKLNIEPYGGAVYTSWLDRPLGIAGKVCTKGKDAFHPVTHLIDSKKPVAVIPGLAIHMNPEINKGMQLNPQLQLLPLVARLGADEKSDYFLHYLELLTGCKAEDILDYELFLYNADPGAEVGLNGEFFSCPRIDNYSSVQAALSALLHADTKEDHICISAFYHNEEIGSATKQGAGSVMTMDLLKRIFAALGFSEEMLSCTIAEGLCLSLDVAHGLHPNYPDKNDPPCQICLGDGVALKLSARQSYATDSSYVSVIEGICRQHNIPYKKFVNRSDQRGGSTLGSITSAKLAIPCVDAGVPILSMHSARELMACTDQEALCALAAQMFRG